MANPYLVSLSLGANPWNCACDHVTQFAYWLEENKDKVVDISQVACFPNNSGPVDSGGGHRFLYDDGSAADCRQLTAAGGVSLLQAGLLTDHLPLVIVLASVVTVVGVAVGVLVYYRLELRVWVFGQWGARLCYAGPAADNETEKMYDAYVAYSLKDEAFVGQVLCPELEHGGGGDPGHRLCLHYRDFPQNGYVADSIVDAVSTSRRTIIVLSKHFLLHEWARYDVKSALADALRRGGGRGRAIILFLGGDIPDRELDPDLRLILKASTKIHWSDRMFWEKLRFHMPPGVPADSSAGGGNRTATANGGGGTHYSLPIYEVPHHLPHHHHTLGLQHKIYEQRTLESQLTAKLY